MSWQKKKFYALQLKKKNWKKKRKFIIDLSELFRILTSSSEYDALHTSSI